MISWWRIWTGRQKDSRDKLTKRTKECLNLCRLCIKMEIGKISKIQGREAKDNQVTEYLQHNNVCLVQGGIL